MTVSHLLELQSDQTGIPATKRRRRRAQNFEHFLEAPLASDEEKTATAPTEAATAAATTIQQLSPENVKRSGSIQDMTRRETQHVFPIAAKKTKCGFEMASHAEGREGRSGILHSSAEPSATATAFDRFCYSNGRRRQGDAPEQNETPFKMADTWGGKETDSESSTNKEEDWDSGCSDTVVGAEVARMVHLFRYGTPEALEIEVSRFGEERLRGLRTADVGTSTDPLIEKRY